MGNSARYEIREGWHKDFYPKQSKQGDRRRREDRRHKERRTKKIPISFPDRRWRSERRSFDRRSTLPVKIFYQLTKPIVRLVLYLFWITEVRGIENVPKKDSAIIAVNHSSYLDFFVVSAVIKRRLYFLAAQELHRVPFLRWFMKYNERIYLDRERPGVKCFREVLKLLRQKKLVVVFPEGTRSQDGKIHRGKLGFVKLAIVGKVPIIPVGISGTFAILPRNVPLPRFSRCCKVHIGEPIFLDRYFGKKISKNALQEIADDIMDRISKLSQIPITFSRN
jgi:1-acyl-sn-glycerol-3-phosphate acyltransferase